MSDTSDWSQGYVTDVLYTDNSYRELSPAWLNYVAAIQGCLPRPLNKPFTYVELGCGLGRTIAHLAAAFPRGQFIGVDFNPAHIDSAQRYAAHLGLGNIRFLERGFEDLVGESATRSLDLPELDFIVLHGVYSWISRSARQAVQRFIYERLKPGGLVYNSYNCLPGWTPEAPLRRLMVELGRSRAGSSADRIAHALEQMSELGKFEVGFLARQPLAKSALQQYRNRPANYLAHEMLNAEWTLFYSADVADEMAAAKLDFLGAATLTENHTDQLMSDAAAAFLASQPDLRLRQLMQDFLLNQRFRRDVFVRGHAHLSPQQIKRHRDAQVFLAVKPLAKLDPKVKIPRGTAHLDPKLLVTLDTVLRAGTASLAELDRAVNKNSGGGDLFRPVSTLLAGNVLMPAAEIFRVGKGFQANGKLRLPNSVNQRLLALAATPEEAAARGRPLISTVFGGSLPIGILHAILLQSLTEAGGLDRAIGKSLEVMAQRGVSLRKDNQTLTDPAAKHAHLTELAKAFIDLDLPILMAAGIVEAV